MTTFDQIEAEGWLTGGRDETIDADGRFIEVITPGKSLEIAQTLAYSSPGVLGRSRHPRLCDFVVSPLPLELATGYKPDPRAKPIPVTPHYLLT